MKTKIIAVTGGIGSGQTSVCKIFEQYGCKVINADLVARQIIDTNSSVTDNIKAEFGSEFFDSKNKLKRKELAKIVFADKNKTQRLNEIVHPVLVKELIQEMEIADKTGKYQIIIVDAALIYELSIERFFDSIVVVNAPMKHRIARVEERDELQRAQILDRMSNQIPLEEKSEWGDFIINNNSTLKVLETQVFNVYEKLLK